MNINPSEYLKMIERKLGKTIVLFLVGLLGVSVLVTLHLIVSGNKGKARSFNAGRITFYPGNQGRKAESEGPEVERAEVSVGPLIKKDVKLKRDSLYAELVKEFYFARIPLLEEFDRELMMLGRCVSIFNPEQAYQGTLNVYIEPDEVLGKHVYVIPETDLDETTSTKRNLNTNEGAQYFHVKKKKEMGRFTALQEFFPKSSLLAEAIAPVFSGSLVFSKNRRLVQSLDKKVEPEEFYKLKAEQTKAKEGSLFLEKLCPELKGCRQSQKGATVNYGDPYIYCRFQTAFKLSSPQQ